MRLTTGRNNNLAISHFSEPKIKEVSLDQIKPLINRVMVLLGIKGENIPQREEKLLIVAFLIENYPNLTLFEIEKAFTLAITGKLQVKATAYQNFSCEYISTILNAYKDYIKENKIYVHYLEEPKEDQQQNAELIKKQHEEFLKRKFDKVLLLLEEKTSEIEKGEKVSLKVSIGEIDSLISAITQYSSFEVSPDQQNYISKLVEGGATKTIRRRHSKTLTLEILFCNMLKEKTSLDPNTFFQFTKKYYEQL